MENILLEMKNITKIFPGVTALDSVDFKLRAGEIHALMGENGAGKSTLIKVLTGVYPDDGGEIYLEGKKIAPKTPLEAQEELISTVYQEVNLCPNLSVAENIFIGREPKKFGMVDWKTMNNRSRKLLETFKLDLDVTKQLSNYSIAIQQMIAIARAVDMNAKVLILDEPTSSLDEEETRNLFSVIKSLKAKGLGIIFVSHFLDQIYELCDTITILRNGKLIGEYDLAKLPRVEMISLMIGKELGEIQNLRNENLPKTDYNVLEANNLGSQGSINPFDLNIKKGEVVGLAGLLGSGRTEMANLFFGIDKATSGDLKINGKDEKLHHPLDAIKNGIALCPEDRKSEGIIGDLTVRENIILGIQAQNGIWSHMPLSKQIEIADKYIDLLQIKVSSRNQLVKTLSGGNQQKVIIARWLATNPDLLILDEPTRGIDIGTKTEIQKMMIRLAKDEDMSVLFISSELDEMLRTCTRLAVLRDRKKIGELTGDDLNSDTVMQTMAGGAVNNG